MRHGERDRRSSLIARGCDAVLDSIRDEARRAGLVVTSDAKQRRRSHTAAGAAAAGAGGTNDDGNRAYSGARVVMTTMARDDVARVAADCASDDDDDEGGASLSGMNTEDDEWLALVRVFPRCSRPLDADNCRARSRSWPTKRSSRRRPRPTKRRSDAPRVCAAFDATTRASATRRDVDCGAFGSSAAWRDTWQVVPRVCRSSLAEFAVDAQIDRAHAVLKDIDVDGGAAASAAAAAIARNGIDRQLCVVSSRSRLAPQANCSCRSRRRWPAGCAARPVSFDL